MGTNFNLFEKLVSKDLKSRLCLLILKIFDKDRYNLIKP